MHYPFHPLHQQALEVVTWSRLGRLVVTVRQPGKTLKIPLWMVEPAAAKIALCDQVELPASVLQGLAALLNAHAHRRHPGRAGDRENLDAPGSAGPRATACASAWAHAASGLIDTRRIAFDRPSAKGRGEAF